MKAINKFISEKLHISNDTPEPLVDFDMGTLIELIKDYRNYAPGRVPGKYLFLEKYMNDGKEFNVQNGEYKGYYIWYTPYEVTRIRGEQDDNIYFTLKKDQFSHIQYDTVARNIKELVDILGIDAANNLYKFLCKKTKRNIDD
jgi:hypothetical protein